MKRVHTLILCFLMIISLVLPVSAAEPALVVDQAGLLTEYDIKDLTDTLESIRDTRDMDVVILLITGLPNCALMTLPPMRMITMTTMVMARMASCSW